MRPNHLARERFNVEEMDPLEAMLLPEPGDEAERTEPLEEEIKVDAADAQAQTNFSPVLDHRGPEPHVPHEQVELPGSPPSTPDELPDISDGWIGLEQHGHGGELLPSTSTCTSTTGA